MTRCEGGEGQGGRMDIVVKWRQLAEPNDQVRAQGGGEEGEEGWGGRQGGGRVMGMEYGARQKAIHI